MDYGLLLLLLVLLYNGCPLPDGYTGSDEPQDETQSDTDLQNDGYASQRPAQGGGLHI